MFPSKSSSSSRSPHAETTEIGPSPGGRGGWWGVGGGWMGGEGKSAQKETNYRKCKSQGQTELKKGFHKDSQWCTMVLQKCTRGTTIVKNAINNDTQKIVPKGFVMVRNGAASDPKRVPKGSQKGSQLCSMVLTVADTVTLVAGSHCSWSDLLCGIGFVWGHRQRQSQSKVTMSLDVTGTWTGTFQQSSHQLLLKLLHPSNAGLQDYCNRCNS